ncbi:hypothetical protein OFQ54_01560 [Brachyspira hyodysenteriae]|uniref:hypothetical protein n=1 Tax=Brachyspira hyodysenteriae TaxID=159 RepID=UPI0022CDB491|nr:hypothetical protein [Brachyspira hyodysenteriae]MCZ9960526.1 hypothetical protein [Brachyspira hyodysenteriae]
MIKKLISEINTKLKNFKYCDLNQDTINSKYNIDIMIEFGDIMELYNKTYNENLKMCYQNASIKNKDNNLYFFTTEINNINANYLDKSIVIELC